LRIDFHTHQSKDNNELSLFNVHRPDLFLESRICSVGLHPWFLSSDSLTSEKEWLLDLIKKEKVLAIGECGLDKLCKVPWNLQLDAFTWQLELAEKMKKPVIVHCVRAQQEILRLLIDFNVEFVFHGFKRSLKMAQEIVAVGGGISLDVHFLRTEVGQQVAGSIPHQFIFLETDDQPISVLEAYICLAEIWQKGLDEVEEIILENAKRIGLNIE
jgi:TatD DNase family protein